MAAHTPDPNRRIGSDHIRAALACLPREEMVAVVLAAVYGLTAREIAEREGIPVTDELLLLACGASRYLFETVVITRVMALAGAPQRGSGVGRAFTRVRNAVCRHWVDRREVGYRAGTHACAGRRYGSRWRPSR
jgi:hypothetical protein